MHFRSSLRIGIIAALFLSSYIGHSQSPAQSDPAIDALRRGDLAGAIAAADQALVKNPKDCRMLTIRGVALKDSGKIDEGLHSFELASASCPKFLPSLEGMAEIQYAQQSPDAAQTLNKILAIDPANQTTHAMLAAVNVRTGNCSEAVEHFAKAGAVLQSNPTAELQYGVCLLALDKNQEAESIFRQMLDQSGTPENRLRYGYACWKNKDYRAADEALAPLIEESSANPQALSLAGQIAEAQGDTPRAVQLLRQAILANPTESTNYLTFAELSFNHQSYQVGIDMLNAGLQQLPKDSRLYVARGVLYVQLNKMSNALEDFRLAHQLDPQLSLAGDAMGMMLDQQHQSRESLAAYEAQAKSHPDDAFIQYLYAEALDSSEQSDSKSTAAAIDAAKRAVALEPDYQPARDLLCAMELRAGHLNEAVQQADEALKRDPNDEAVLYQKMMAYRRLGKKDEVNDLVVRMKKAHEYQQGKRTKYQLQEIGSSGSSNP